jgi:hypothetical protein
VPHVIALKCEKEKEKEEYTHTHIYNDKNNSKFNISHTLCVKIMRKPSKNPLIKGFPISRTFTCPWAFQMVLGSIPC